MSKTLYIIDGHSQIYRAYYAPFGDLTSPTGEPTRATHVFCAMLLKFIRERRPDYLAMAVDGPSAKLLRRRQYPQYKITRKPAPDDFQPQATRIIEIVTAMGIPVLEAEGYEADDIMATAAEKFASSDMDVILVSRDKDLDQLVGDHTRLFDPTKDVVIDAASIEADKGYSPTQAVEIQTLMGDSTDNIPGVAGVGPKTAVKLIAKYGTADAVLAHADEQTPKLRQRLLAAHESIALSRELVTLCRQVPMELDLDAMKFTGIETGGVRAIFAELGLQSLIGRLDDLTRAPRTTVTDGEGPLLQGIQSKETLAPADSAEAPQSPSTLTRARDFEYTCIDTPEGLADLAEQLKGVTSLAVDTETTSVLPMWADLVGVSLAWEEGKACYIPVKGPLTAVTLDIDAVREAIGPVLADESVEKIGHNLKYDMIVLARAGVELKGPIYDTMIAAHVLDSSRRTYKMDLLAAELLNHQCIPIEDIIGKGRNQTTMDAAPVELVVPYAAEDADVTLRLAGVLRPRLDEQGLAPLMDKLEMPLLPVLAAMERRGITVDPAELNRQASALSARADELRERIVKLAGHEFNPDSPRQLAVVLFNKLGLKVIKRKKTGPSTDESVLSQLAVEHELPAVILDYRKLTKLIGTYLKALTKRIHPTTGRVHTSFHQGGTTTGRLSSSDPNLQNIPIRSEAGRQIRSAFVAREGSVLLSADYSQIELRVLAHLCEDPTLMEAFHRDQDIHRIVAAEVFHVPLAEVTPEQRSRAKGVNFGIIYGQTAHGLSVALRIGRAEAAEFISAYKQRFPKIDEFLQMCIAAAKRDGYVQTIFARRRHIAEIGSHNAQRKAAAERMALNSVVQGSAADLIKQAMVNIDTRVRRENRPTDMLLQIHDELVFEIPTDHVETERKMIIAEMTGAIELNVPLKVDVATGNNWMEAK